MKTKSTFILRSCIKVIAGIFLITAIFSCSDEEKAVKSGEKEPAEILEDLDLPNTMNVTVYAYCPCSICNTKKWKGKVSTGHKMKTILAQGKKIAAADPDVIPLGTTIIYDGEEYLVTDTGADIKGNTINILLENHKEVYKFGVKRNQTITIEQ